MGEEKEKEEKEVEVGEMRRRRKRRRNRSRRMSGTLATNSITRGCCKSGAGGKRPDRI